MTYFVRIVYAYCQAFTVEIKYIVAGNPSSGLNTSWSFPGPGATKSVGNHKSKHPNQPNLYTCIPGYETRASDNDGVRQPRNRLQYPLQHDGLAEDCSTRDVLDL